MIKMYNAVQCCLILVIGMTGCSKKEDAKPQLVASVSIFHSSPDAPEISISIDALRLHLSDLTDKKEMK